MFLKPFRYVNALFLHFIIGFYFVKICCSVKEEKEQTYKHIGFVYFVLCYNYLRYIYVL